MIGFLTGINKWVYIGVAIVIGALALFGYIEHERVVAAEAKLAVVELQRDVEAQHAKDAQKVIDQLQEISAREQEARTRLAQNKVSRDTTTKQIVKDTRNAPDANQVAGPAFDALADSLRVVENAHK